MLLASSLRYSPKSSSSSMTMGFSSFLASSIGLYSAACSFIYISFLLWMFYCTFYFISCFCCCFFFRDYSVSWSEGIISSMWSYYLTIFLPLTLYRSGQWLLFFCPTFRRFRSTGLPPYQCILK